jgi:uncharacterized RDD family membrane protein YckC/DnaJ-domain-containing protein 1
MTETHYELLGVEPDASKEEIRSAYRERLDALRDQVEKGRSDQARNGARDETARLNAAWQVLSDPFQRQRYDASITDGSVTDDDEEIQEGEERATAPAPARRRGLFVPREPRERDARGRPQRRDPVGVPGAEAAPVGRRLAALSIDLVTAGAVVAGLQSALGYLLEDSRGKLSVGATVILQLSFFVLLFAYFVIPTARSGQTLGKRLTHVMAVDAETGGLPTPRRAALRYLLPIVFVAALGQLGALAGLLIGVSWMLIDTRIGLMDRLGRTRVVVARYRPARSPR